MILLFIHSGTLIQKFQAIQGWEFGKNEKSKKSKMNSSIVHMVKVMGKICIFKMIKMATHSHKDD